MVCFHANAYAQQRITPDYLFNSDPTVQIINGKFWLFTCHDQASVQFQGPEDYWHNIQDFQAYSTTDLKNWKHHGTILNIFDISWADDFPVWDGDAGIAANGKYYAYVSARINGAFAVGVMMADKPEGPYVDVLKRPLITSDTIVAHGVPYDKKKQSNVTSPTVVYGDDNKPYLLFGQFGLYLVPLKPNMIEFDGKIQELNIPYYSGKATEYIEGPMLNKMNNRWYFTYMTYKNWDGFNPNFSDKDPFGPYIQYCVADKITGPFNNPRHLIYPLDSLSCNSAHFIVPYKGKLVLVYHVPYKNKQHRQIAITELKVNADGSLQPVFPKTDKGIIQTKDMRLTLDAYAYKREAEEFQSRKGATEERGLKQDFHLKMKNNGFLKFAAMDFGAGADSVRVAVSCENSKVKNAKLEFRLDSPTGKLIAEVPIGFTYWITYYKSLTGKTIGAAGVHDLYLVAKGEGGDAYGRLFNVNWFTFFRNEKEQ